MRAALPSRLERLEIRVEAKKPQPIRSGYLKTLPTDYVGERHVVIVKREPAGVSGTFEWCEFEERPGPAPVDALEYNGISIHLIYRDVEIHQGEGDRDRAYPSAVTKLERAAAASSSVNL
jgi:hypothetical protein